MTDILAERQKTHGDFYDVAMVAQELKDVLRRGKNWKMLDDAQREALEMVATKIARILSGNPHEVDHYRDGAGYFQLIVNAYSGAGCDPTRRPGAHNPETPSHQPPAFVVPGRATLP